MPTLRLLVAAAAASAALGLAGVVPDAARVGDTGEAVTRVQEELSRRLTAAARATDALAIRVARRADVVAAAVASRDAIPALFAELDAAALGTPSASVTIWVLPPSPASGHRVIAWSGGPSEDVAEDLIARAPTQAIVPGAGGLRLVSLRPIELDGRRLGAALAETVLSAPSLADAFTPAYRIPSSFGPVSVRPPGDPAPLSGEGSDSGDLVRFAVVADGTPITLDCSIDRAGIGASRARLRWRAALLAALPWMVLAWLVTRRTLADRWRRRDWRRWLSRSLVAVGTASLPLMGFVAIAPRAGVPEPWIHAAEALWALAVAAIIPASVWWRPGIPSSGPVPRGRWLMEQLGAGAAVTAGLWATARLWDRQLTPASIHRWELPVLAADPATIAALCAMLLSQIAIAWTVAGTVAYVGVRSRVTGGAPRDWIAVVIWVVAPVMLAASSLWSPPLPWPRSFAAGAALAAFGVMAPRIRRAYRDASEARRIMLAFGSLLLPVLACYPIAAGSADRASRTLVESEYAPATSASQQPAVLLATLRTTQAEIDGLAGVDLLLVPRPDGSVSSHPAFTLWSQTTLSRNRLTSEVELYAADRRLVSHFSLNVPEYQTRELTWQGAGCGWSVFAELARFVAGQPRMLHAERGLCRPDGTFLGAIVVRLVADYRALPFVTSANPYHDVIGASQAVPGSRLRDLQVVVYGWSLQPRFASGRVTWQIDGELDRALYESRAPRWVSREAAGRRFHVYFVSDRSGVYAVGYPAPTGLQHAIRLSETAAVLAALFLGYLLLSTALAPMMHARPTVLRTLIREVRASFYRKLFLFFVGAAVLPVVLFAFAFGAYMSARLRANVEAEAAEVVGVARRVFDELSAAQARPGESRLESSDDVMVWIRQVIDQEVNLFDGPRLIATSQRDLFDSGLLPARTPAAVYREIVLDRQPLYVGEDRIGPFRYLVAAAPAPAVGRDAVLSVPLASRQREIEREIDELTRGVLAGAVLVIFFAAALGASVAARVSDPVARLTRATRLVAQGRLDERLLADSADELGRLVADFNTMVEMLASQRAELAKANQLQAWAEMSRQVAHDVKNPLTPIQLAAEHLARIHEDQGRPLGDSFDQCVSTILKQVRLLRRIASEFSTYAVEPPLRVEAIDVPDLIAEVLAPYRAGLVRGTTLDVVAPGTLPRLQADRTQLVRALTNLVENAFQAMPSGGRLRVAAIEVDGWVRLDVDDTGVGLEPEAVSHAFEPYFSTKATGSGLGLANARRAIERCGGTITMTSEPGRGTTVTLMLPAAPHAGPSSESRPTQ